MAIALVASVSAGSPTGSANFATTGITTTGATLLVAAVSEYEGGITGGSTVSDSKSNTWTPLTLWVEGGVSNRQVRLFYAVPDTAHLDLSHTFTCVSAGIAYSILTVAAFSGTLGTAPFDQQNGADAYPVATIQAGSVTPSEAGELLVAVATEEGYAISGIDSGFTIVQSVTPTGTLWTAALAWRVQATAGPINPTWTLGGADNASAALATFKAAPAAIALIASESLGSTDTQDVTTPAMNTTGANCLVAVVASYYAETGYPPTMTTVQDSKANTWVPLATYQETGTIRLRTFYVENAIVSTGAADHTVTTVGADNYPALAVAAFSNVKTSGAFDQQNGATQFTPGVTSFQAGSVTPTEAGELVVAGTFFNPNHVISSITGGGGFTLLEQAGNPGTSFGVGLAYLIQTTPAAAANPTWNYSGAVYCAANLATFKAGAGAAPPAVVVADDLMLLGVG